MIFKPFYYFNTGCAAYVLGCGGLGKCAVVDPQERDSDAYLDFAASKDMKISHVIDTHVHADHRSGGRALAAKAQAHYCLHESAPVIIPFKPLRDGEYIEVGNVHLKVLHTPGHTPESLCLLVTDSRRSPEPWFILTGDTLFIGSVGRPDLPGHARENAALLFDSIHDKLMTLPGELEIFPGHFSGSVCGAGMSGKPSSTMAFERRWNPLLSKSREEFISAVSDVPPKPSEMAGILKFNQGEIEQPL